MLAPETCAARPLHKRSVFQNKNVSDARRAERTAKRCALSTAPARQPATAPTGESAWRKSGASTRRRRSRRLPMGGARQFEHAGRSRAPGARLASLSARRTGPSQQEATSAQTGAQAMVGVRFSCVLLVVAIPMTPYLNGVCKMSLATDISVCEKM
jgi:hypothetical protein